MYTTPRTFVASLGIASLLLGACTPADDAARNSSSSSAPSKTEFSLTSPAFSDGGEIPAKYTCDGDNISPPLLVLGTSPRTRSLVLIVDDPDAGSGDFVHYVAWNLPRDTRDIQEGSVPPLSSPGLNGTGKTGYTGPCPPSGMTHSYRFKLYALNTPLAFTNAPTREQVEEKMRGHTIDRVMLTATYTRKAQ